MTRIGVELVFVQKLTSERPKFFRFKGASAGKSIKEEQGMAREAVLYNAAQGSPLEGYFLLKAEGKNMPPAFSERAAQSR